MKMKKTVIALGAALILGLTGCGGQTQVNVEQAGMLASAATSTDKFAGVVVSENVVEIDRDTEKQIDELYVAAGDVVRVNEKLFEYDTDTLSLTIDKTNNVDQFNMKKAGEVMNAYKQEQIVPYLDKYRMNKWSKDGGMHYALEADPTMDTIAQIIIKARNAQRNRRVTGNSALIIPYQYLDVLSLSTQWVKLEKLGGQVLTKGTMGQFYGMDVVPFIDELMPEKAWFMIMGKKASIAPKKINSFKGHVNPPRINGDLLEFLMYHDAFVLGKKADDILVASMTEDVCAVPKIDVSGNNATITAAGSTIYYTTNGADPRYSVEAKTYTGPVALTAGDQLRAYAAAEGKYNSDVAKYNHPVSN